MIDFAIKRVKVAPVLFLLEIRKFNMLKMAELEELKQKGLKFVSCYIEVMKDIMLISSNSCSKFNSCLKLPLNIDMSNFCLISLGDICKRILVVWNLNSSFFNRL